VTNAATDDLSVFSVASDGSIELRERVHTGDTPKRVADRDGLVVVLNTGEPGLTSFRLDAECIEPVVGGELALAARSAGPSSRRTTGSPSRTTSPTAPSRASRSTQTVRSRWRMRRQASRSRASRGCATRTSPATGASSTRSTPTGGSSTAGRKGRRARSSGRVVAGPVGDGGRARG
jgi:hypothetical protein